MLGDTVRVVKPLLRASAIGLACIAAAAPAPAAAQERPVVPFQSTWAAAYSLQFEFGPLSEASVGNVGMHPETTGWVDRVVTPVGAFGLIVAEDALDRWFVR